MPVSRRSSATPIAAALLLTAALAAGCTSPSPSSPTPSPSSSAPAPESENAPGAGEWNVRPASVAAIGDSITTAFDACSLLSDCPEVSWATGTDARVASLARQLLGDSGAVGERSWNYAESGAHVSDLPAQARRAAAHEPELLTVMIGGNDACAPDVASMTDVEDFRADFTETMDILREESPDTQVYVSSVPDLMRLWSEGSGSALARAVWQLAGICPAMLGDPGDASPAADERRTAVRERVQDYNAVLAEVCSADRLCRYDGGAVFDYAFTADHISDWDWFHPSREGQSELAALAFEQVTAE
ncbi:GDSL-type esterase/lipase family protein [Streptomyces sp. DSM 44917]|uniref:GDSL-type esterase/lipase family protein n=1 Tax=Streptomyces boetiae TaxID=3075541 RepID=A0ABU2LG88_9ACTN|nr:SGNH/GDSL hydrolase family protein [Streptomyces sp. DSM 44917]MDT0310178.1 GDSL-type esterase/lipase family protein [Streptomyces sp. DSM 44917]